MQRSYNSGYNTMSTLSQKGSYTTQIKHNYTPGKTRSTQTMFNMLSSTACTISIF